MITACIITTYIMLNVPSVEKAPRIIHRQNAEQLKNGTGEQTMTFNVKLNEEEKLTNLTFANVIMESRNGT